MSLPPDPFGRAKLPPTFDRQGRVALLYEAFSAWASGRQPSDAARVFASAGAMAWLQQGGDVARDYWRVTPQQGSRHTPAALLRLAHRDERKECDGAAKCEGQMPSTDSE